MALATNVTSLSNVMLEGLKEMLKDEQSTPANPART
jgi:hypothetical protein